MNDIELGDLKDVKIDNEKYKQMWLDLVQVEGFSDYLKETMALDMKRYFYIPVATQERVKGHFDLANYLLNVLTLTNKQKLDKKP